MNRLAVPILVLLGLANLVFAQGSPRENREVVVLLKKQPAAKIAPEIRAKNEPRIRALSDQLRWLIRGSSPLPSLRPEQEKQYQTTLDSPAISVLRRNIAEQIDAIRDETANEIRDAIEPLTERDYLVVAEFIQKRGGIVTGRTSVINAVFARVDSRTMAELAKHPLVAIVSPDNAGSPELDIHKQSLGLTTGFWANGFDGNVQDAGVLDTGVQQNHPAFASHVFESSAGTTDSDGHGTGIAGIMASGDATYRGMAFGCDRICVAAAGADSASMTGMNWLMTSTVQRPENINYSFGNGTANTVDYNSLCMFFDAVVDTFNVMVSKSTGNNGWSSSGQPTITFPAPSYNLMASANMDDFNTVTRTDDRITSSSSRGPTLSGRKKPDITAPGTNSFTTTRLLGFDNLGGTSSASPHTGGGALLLFDLGLVDAMATKAVLINAADAMTDNNTSSTADDAYLSGSNWNKTYGWGYLDLGEAYLNGLDVFVDTLQAPTGQSQYKFFKGQLFATEKATLTWQRHVSYNGAAYPTIMRNLSNLDLRCYNQSGGSLMSSSLSTIDNVEQLSVNADANVVLKVSTTGNFDPNVASEKFALATEENFVAAAGPNLSVSIVVPDSAPLETVTQLKFIVTNNGDLPAQNVVLTAILGLPITGVNPRNLGTLAPGQFAEAVYNMEVVGTANEINIQGTATSNSYGETFTYTASKAFFAGGFSVSQLWNQIF